MSLPFSDSISLAITWSARSMLHLKFFSSGGARSEVRRSLTELFEQLFALRENLVEEYLGEVDFLFDFDVALDEVHQLFMLDLLKRTRSGWVELCHQSQQVGVVIHRLRPVEFIISNTREKLKRGLKAQIILNAG